MTNLPQGQLSAETHIPDTNRFLGATDSELITAIGTGDEQAFALLMDRHLGSIMALGYRILGNPADADEVAQETFLRFWNRARDWDIAGKASIRTWLSRVASNLCIDRLRRKPLEPIDAAMELADTQPDALEQLRQERRHHMVQELLKQLPDRQRVATVLSYYEGMSTSEVASAMGLSVRAVESLLVRARRRLRGELGNRGINLEETI